MNLNKNWWQTNSVMGAVIALVFLLVYIQVYDNKIAILGDNAAYYLLGKGIANGHGFTNYFSAIKNPHNHYPPGYPFLISCIMLITSSIQVIKIFNGILLLGTVLLTYFIAVRQNVRPILALVISLALLLNTNLLYYGSLMMSEVPFAFFSILTLFLFLNIDLKNKPFKNPLFYLVILLIVYCFYIRAFGVALAGAVIFYLLYFREFKLLFTVAAGFVLGILPWQIRSANLGGSSQLSVIFRKNYYAPESGNIDLGDMAERIFNNLISIISEEMPQALFPAISQQPTEGINWGMTVLGIGMILLMVYAAYKLKAAGFLLGTYLLLTILILLIWPNYFSSLRYFAPVIPVMSILFLYGLWLVGTLIIKQLHNTFSFPPAFLFVILLFYIKPLKDLNYASQMPYPITWSNYFTLADWVKQNIPEDATVSCRKPFLFYLYSERVTTHYAYTENSLELIDDFRKKGVDYVVYDRLGFGTTPRYLGKAIEENQQYFEHVVSLGPQGNETYLFRFISNP